MPRAMPALHAVVSPDVSACGSLVLPQTTLRCSVLSSILPVGVLYCPFQSSSVSCLVPVLLLQSGDDLLISSSSCQLIFGSRR